MILETINEPTVTVTLTLTELRRIRDAHGWAMEVLDSLETRDSPHTKGQMKEHTALQKFFKETIADAKMAYS